MLLLPPPSEPHQLLLTLVPLQPQDITPSSHPLDRKSDRIFLSFEHPNSLEHPNSPGGISPPSRRTIRHTHSPLSATQTPLAPKFHLLLRSLLPLESHPTYHATQPRLCSSCSDQLLLPLEPRRYSCALVVLRLISSAQVTNLAQGTSLPIWPLHARAMIGTTAPLKRVTRHMETVM